MPTAQANPVQVLDGQLFATVQEVAGVMRTDERTVRRAIAAGQIPAIKASNTTRVPVQWLRQQALLADTPEMNGAGPDTDPAAATNLRDTGDNLEHDQATGRRRLRSA